MTHDESALLAAVAAAPAEPDGWFVLADWLDDHADPRGELIRLTLRLTRDEDVPDRSACEERQRALVAAGVRACTHRLVNSIGMELALIPPGTFWMGSNNPDDSWSSRRDEWPGHRVTLQRAFYLGACTVTVGQYHRVLGIDPTVDWPDRLADVNPDRFPVTNIDWSEAAAFCARLSALPVEAAAGRFYRLPTEAEWEYACRAGSSTSFSFGETLPAERACFDTEDGRWNFPVEVGTLPPNAFGLHEMHGNVWEWCADWYGEYAPGSVVDPTGAASGMHYVVRGGSWTSGDYDCRSATRGRLEPMLRDDDLGFRVVLEVRG